MFFFSFNSQQKAKILKRKRNVEGPYCHGDRVSDLLLFVYQCELFGKDDIFLFTNYICLCDKNVCV